MDGLFITVANVFMADNTPYEDLNFRQWLFESKKVAWDGETVLLRSFIMWTLRELRGTSRMWAHCLAQYSISLLPDLLQLSNWLANGLTEQFNNPRSIPWKLLKSFPACIEP